MRLLPGHVARPLRRRRRGGIDAHGRRVYYFESALSPYVVGVDLTKIDFAPGSSIRSVALEGDKAYQLSGDISDELQPAEPIVYPAP
ncbi:MAG: hypothetical protein WCR51_08875 [Planctomycetia bacterium]